MNLTYDNVFEEIKKFQFKTDGRAEFSEVDSFDVVHNIRYLYWMERARLEYFENIGVPMHRHTITNEFPIMVVKTKIQYVFPLRFTDRYQVMMRVAELNNSSMKVQNVVVNGDDKVAAFAEAVLVHLDKHEMKSKRIPETIRQMIKNYEGDNLIINEK